MGTKNMGKVVKYSRVQLERFMVKVPESSNYYAIHNMG